MTASTLQAKSLSFGQISNRFRLLSDIVNVQFKTSKDRQETSSTCMTKFLSNTAYKTRCGCEFVKEPMFDKPMQGVSEKCIGDLLSYNGEQHPWNSAA